MFTLMSHMVINGVKNGSSCMGGGSSHDKGFLLRGGVNTTTSLFEYWQRQNKASNLWRMEGHPRKKTESDGIQA